LIHPSDSRRPTCQACQRPQRTCICQWIRPTAHAVEVLILQHPLEVDNAKGSARLLHLSLPNSRLVTGEVFDEQALWALLYAPLRSGQALSKAILLYPESPEKKAANRSESGDASWNGPPSATACDREPHQLRLVVLDGTWRKSRKMLHLNPLLRKLPRLALRDLPASRYRIRKAHQPDQLSTLEACCHALMQLEGSDEDYRPLLDAFDGFVAQQLEYRRAAGPL
jgi:DTW domain-containing protein YfiP